MLPVQNSLHRPRATFDIYLNFKKPLYFFHFYKPKGEQKLRGWGNRKGTKRCALHQFQEAALGHQLSIFLQMDHSKSIHTFTYDYYVPRTVLLTESWKHP